MGGTREGNARTVGEGESGIVRVLFGGETLELLPERAILLPDHGALLVADLHLGKGKAFRMRGIPVPAGSMQHDLAALSTLITRTHANVVYILGDLWHGSEGLSPEILLEIQRWMESHSRVEFRLVPGNHDPVSSGIPNSLRLNVMPEPCHLGALQLAHHPPWDAGVYTIAGHLHPVIRLRDAQRASMRLPCFLLRDKVLTLPAFGTFTGGCRISPKPGDRIFLAAGDSIMEFSPR